jgi:predicted  nucleic acid-binding Zn-ribbon protein
MAQKRLSEDEIKYTVSAETAKAQQEIYNLTKATKALKKEEKERRTAMVELEAQGKKNSKEYQNLEKEAKNLSKQISANNKEVQQLTKTMGVNDMTMTQLKKHAKELERQLDNTAESANPEEYASLNKRLADVRDRMKQLRTSGLEVNKQMDQSTTIMNKLKMAAKAFIAVKVVGWLKSAHDQAYNTRKEFAKYEAVLRNTFQSQEKANEAMKMLQQLAANTPSSLQEWTEGYIKLVNRGLQPTSQELTNLGDLAASQGKSLDQLIEAVLDAMTGENERLKEFGIKASKEGEKTQFTFRGVTTEVRNSEDAIKDYLLSLGRLEGVAGSMAVQMNELEGIQSNLGDTMDAFFNKVGKKLEPFWKSILKGANGVFSELNKMFTSYSEQYDNHLEQMVNLETELPKLLDKYEELSSTSNLSAEKHEELRSVMRQITDMVPEAAGAFNDYGEVISISTEKVEEFMATQRALLLYENKKAIEETERDLEKLRTKQKQLQAYRAQGGKTVVRSQGPFAPSITYVDKSSIGEVNNELAEIGNLIKGSEEKLKRLRGETLEDAVKQHKEMLQQRETFNNMNKQQLDAWIKDEKNAASQYMEMAKEVYEKRFPAATTTKTDSKSKGKDEKISPVKTLSPEELANIDLQVELEEEKELYHKQQVELKELFASGRDENLQSEAEYNEALEQLAMMHLERMLDIAGLDADQRRSIEEQLLEFKVKCMQDELAERERLENEKVRNEELNASKQQAAFQKRVQTYLNYGEQVGNALGDIISGQEDAMEGFADSLVDIVFDVLTQIINAELIKLTGIGLSTTAEATAKQIASKGYAGIATGAALAAVITAGISAAKSTLKGLIGKRKDSGSTTSESSSTTYQRVAKGLESGGSIDIVRSQDGKKFPSAVYAPDKRGYINRPTVIVGDGPVGQSREWVASNAAVNNPTVAPILDLIDHSQQAGTIRTLDLNQAIRSRLIGYSSGGTITNHPITTMSSNKSDETSSPVLERFVQVIEKLERNGIPASVVLTELDRKQKLRDRSRKLGSK